MGDKNPKNKEKQKKQALKKGAGHNTAPVETTTESK